MIRHCVFVKFRNDVGPEERSAIHADLEALRQVVDGMDTVNFSGNVSPEPFARGFTHGFTSISEMLPRETPTLPTKRISVPARGWSPHSRAAPRGCWSSISTVRTRHSAALDRSRC